MTLSLGLSFFTPENAAGRISRHLWVVVSDPAADERVATVNFSTKPPLLRSDNAPYIVHPREPPTHPSISEPSYVRCDQARLTLQTELDRLINVRTLVRTRDAPPELVTKPQQVLLASRATKLEIKLLLKAQGCV